MNSPGIRPHNNKPAADGQHALLTAGANGPRQALRVLAEDGATRAAAASIAMPRAKTDLSDLLAGDDVLCVRRRAPAAAARPNAAGGPGASAINAGPQPESQAALAAESRAKDLDAAPRARTADGHLDRVIAAWPVLPRNVRAGILAMIRESSNSE